MNGKSNVYVENVNFTIIYNQGLETLQSAHLKNKYEIRFPRFETDILTCSYALNYQQKTYKTSHFLWSGYKTATFKTVTSQNSDCYITATKTKQRQLQNSDNYKTATVTKRRKLIY